MSTIPRLPSKPRSFWLRLAAGSAILLIVLAGIIVNLRDSIVAKQDRLAVAAVDAELARELGDDPELRGEHGGFLRLEGEGFSRQNYVWMMWPRIEWQREAVFENGRVPIRITLFADESTSLGKKQWRFADWNYDVPSGISPGTLEVEVYPRGPDDPSMEHHVTAVALSEDAARLLIAGPGRCDVWDTRSRGLVRSLKGKFGFIERIEFADGAGKIAISSLESTRILDPEAGTTVANWTKGILTNSAGPIDISRDGKTVLGNIRDPKQRGANPESQTFQPDPAPHRIANIHREGRMKPILATAMPGESARHVFLSPDGSYAMLGLSSSFVEVWWDVREERAIAEGPVGDPVAAMQRPWEGLVVFGPRTGDALVWRKIPDHPGPPVRLALPSLSQTIRFETPKVPVGGHDAHAMAISGDERWLALLTQDAVLVWDAATGKLMRSANAAGFGCWMTVSSQTGLSVAPDTRASPLAFRDGKALSIGSDGSLKLATLDYRGVHLWTEYSK